MMIGEERVQQRDRALAEANRIRTARKEFKRQLADGEVELGTLLMEPPEEILTAEVGQFLEWMPGIGRWRAGKILQDRYGGGPIVGRAVRIEHLSLRTRERIRVRIEDTHPIRIGPATPVGVAV